MIYILPFICCIIITSCVCPHTKNIQQGNIIVQDNIDQLKIGMTKQQVRYVLGNALIIDPFYQNRWDYIDIRYGYNKQHKIKNKLTLYFNSFDKLIAIHNFVKNKKNKIQN